MKCLANQKDLRIAGNFDSPEASNIMMVIERCANSTDPGAPLCKSDEEIDAFLSWKYIFFVQNSRKFIQYKFD